MADFSMWGPEAGGARLAEQDAIKRMSELAVARRQRAEAGQKELELQGQQSFMARLGQRQGKPGQTLAEQAEEMAQLAFDSGMAGKGVDLAAKAALVRTREAQAEASKATAARRQLQGQLDALTKATSFYEGVTDQAGLDKANALYAYTFGGAAPTAGLPYSPQLVEQLRNFGTKATERLRAGLAELDTASKIANRDSAIDLRNFRKGILREQADLQERREARLAKGGAGSEKPVGTPSAGELKAADVLLKSEFSNLPLDERRQAAFSVASRARALRKANPALDADTAIRQAFTEEKASGNFQAVERAYGLLPSRQGYNKAGTAGEAPLQVPTGQDGQPQLSALKPGKIYQTPKGTLRYLGPNKWEAVQTRVSPTGIPAALPDEDEDEEE